MMPQWKMIVKSVWQISELNCPGVGGSCPEFATELSADFNLELESFLGKSVTTETGVRRCPVPSR